MVSVTSLEAVKVLAENGTWFPGSALSSHSVPLKMLRAVPPLSVTSVTIVPAGDVSVISKSLGVGCVMNVLTRTWPIWVPAPATTMDDAVTAGESANVTGVEFVIDVVVEAGATGSVLSSIPQLESVPPLPERSSETLRVQLPRGFSP